MSKYMLEYSENYYCDNWMRVGERIKERVDLKAENTTGQALHLKHPPDERNCMCFVA